MSLKQSIGMCIDLTSGTRPYAESEWDDWDVDYANIACAPLGKSLTLDEPTPSEEIVARFVKTVSDFWGKPQNRSRIIAVHCVTGFNITGYLITR